MKQAINDYLNFVYQSRSPKTYVTYASRLLTFIDTVGDDAELTKDTYVKFLKKTADMNPSTQALCRSAVKGLYIYSGVDASFFPQIDKTFAVKRAQNIVLFNKDGIEKIIQYVNTIRNKIEDYRDRAFIFLLADSGLRISEACDMRVGDVDLLEERAVITGKGNKKAVIKISHRTAESIKEYLIETTNASRWVPLFRRHDNKVRGQIKPVKPDGMWHAIKRRAIEAGVDPKTVRPHDFRHYFVTVVYHAKGIRFAQKLARHERIETTSRYTHLVEDEGEAYNEIFNKE